MYTHIYIYIYIYIIICRYLYQPSLSFGDIRWENATEITGQSWDTQLLRGKARGIQDIALPGRHQNHLALNMGKYNGEYMGIYGKIVLLMEIYRETPPGIYANIWAPPFYNGTPAGYVTLSSRKWSISSKIVLFNGNMIINHWI